MPAFRVKFVNRLLSSEGRPFKCVQREVPIDLAPSAEDAVKLAQRRFEELERIGDWRMRAQSFEVELTEAVGRPSA
jgi:hypothetical protein